MDAEENQKQVFPRRPQPLEIAARFPHSHRRDEAVEVENQKQVFPLSTATGWLFRPNSERRPGGGASLLLQAHCSIRKCSISKNSCHSIPRLALEKRRYGLADRKRAELRTQIRILQPAMFVPF